MPKTMRERYPKCSARKTAKGVPYACFATKTEKCATLALEGRHPAECRRPLRSTSIARRPIGNPIDPCVVTRADLEDMTVKRILGFMRKYHIPVPQASPITGRALVKEELIQVALAGAQSCPRGGPPIDLETATTRELGLALKYRGVEPPMYGDGTCGFVKPKSVSQLRFNMIGKGKKTPCRAQLKALLQKRLALAPVTAPQAVTVVTKAPGGITLIKQETPKPVEPLVQSPSQATIPVQVEIKVPEKGTPPVEMVVVQEAPAVIETPAGPVAESKIATPKVVMKKVFDPSSGANKIEIKTIVPDGAEMDGSTFTASAESFVIDQKCVLNWKPDKSVTPMTADMKSGALFLTCSDVRGKQVCNRVLLNIVPLGKRGDVIAVTNWKNRVAQYAAIAAYQKSLKSVLVMPFTGAWLCGKDDVSFEYKFTNSEGKVEKLSPVENLTGFMSVAVPKDRTYLTLAETIMQFPSLDVYKLVTDLILRFKEIGYVPRHIYPQNVGFLMTGFGPSATITAVLNPPLTEPMDEAGDFQWDSNPPTYNRDMMPIAPESKYREYVADIITPH